jgi:hypothetical protein
MISSMIAEVPDEKAFGSPLVDGISFALTMNWEGLA